MCRNQWLQMLKYSFMLLSKPQPANIDMVIIFLILQQHHPACVKKSAGKSCISNLLNMKMSSFSISNQTSLH